MALRMSTDLKNFIINKSIITVMAGTYGTAGTASLMIYTGTQPATGDSATSGTVLCVISLIGWAGSLGCTAGTADLARSSGYTGTASVTGTAGWARMQTIGTGYLGSAATFRMDGEVGTAASCVFLINTVDLRVGGVVSLLTAPISLA